MLDIFETFHRTQKPLSLTDLAELTGIPKSSCHAIVGTLTARGYRVVVASDVEKQWRYFSGTDEERLFNRLGGF